MCRLFFHFIFLLIFTIAYADHPHIKQTEFIQRKEVQLFINDMINKHKFKREELTRLFSHVKLRPKVIQYINCPFEQKPWYNYRPLYVTEKRISNGVFFWKEYEEALRRAESLYNVPANIIVATIGIETKYGKDTGKYPVIDALVNLAFDHAARNTYFRKELEEFLLLTREQHLNPLTVMGSYAGAIGQPQFMPSSYRRYAVNFSGNTKIDLSNNEVDVIGSIANFYHKKGWQINQPVALPLSMQGGRFQLSLSKPKTISLFELIENGNVPSSFFSNKEAKLIVLRGNYGNEYWYGFHNFDVIKRYNHSDLYAMAVFQLSYYLTMLRGE